jgi:translation initiation factor 2 subunit 2
MSDDKYYDMLEEIYKQIKPKKVDKGRFRVPYPRFFYQGNKTVFINFKEIADYINRDYKIFRTFLAKELASPTSPSNGRLIFHSRIDPQTLQSAIDYFVRKYVICPICGGPDTQLIITKRNWMIKCEICGAESPVLEVK